MTDVGRDPGPQQQDGRLLLDARTVAGLLSVSPRTVWSWSASGRMPRPVRVGRVTRWKRSEVERWIELGCPKRT